MLVVHSGTILMCHLISNHTVLLQKREEERRERWDRTVWKVQRKNGNWGRRGKRRGVGVGGCRGKEISVSAKVFIKILRQMISVSFS